MIRPSQLILLFSFLIYSRYKRNLVWFGHKLMQTGFFLPRFSISHLYFNGQINRKAFNHMKTEKITITLVMMNTHTAARPQNHPPTSFLLGQTKRKTKHKPLIDCDLRRQQEVITQSLSTSLLMNGVMAARSAFGHSSCGR